MLVDTNIIVDLFRGSDPTLDIFLGEQLNVYIPTIVLGELYLGAYRSSNPRKQLEKIKNFLRKCTVIDIDDETAHHYGLIKTELLNKGKPIPENDIWITAVAKQYKFLILTKDRHFEWVPGLLVKFW